MDIRKRFFKESDIPYEDLKRLGISKLDILSLDRKNIDALLSGYRTKLFDMDFTNNNGERIAFKGKISLYRKEDDSVGIKVHPARHDILNDINLKQKELQKLKDGEIISKVINDEKYLVQLDKETNELLRVKTNSIHIPKYILDKELTLADRNKLKHGETITLGDSDKQVQVKLDLNNPQGISFLDYQQKQRIEYDRLNPQVTDTIQTDRNRQDFLDYQNKQESNKTLKL